MSHRTTILLAATLALVSSACADGSDSAATSTSLGTTTETVQANETEPPTSTSEQVGETSTFVAEVWADNWFALYANGELVGEDSVPITTERSFNAETITFEATYPLTLAIEAKDFKETDSGIEYIGESNQQMGDGGLIAQITDTVTGDVVAVTNGDWSVLVVHRAPLNVDCERDPDPDATCQSDIIDPPAGWTNPAFDDGTWTNATEWTADAVSPKDGYDQINWSDGARLVWGADLEVDNTVLLRLSIP